MLKKLKLPNLQNHIWILISTLIVAPFAQILGLITTRIINLETAGEIAYAVAITSIFIVFVIFSANQKQMVDTREEFTFGNYLNFRTITSLIASLLLVLFLIILQQNMHQTLIIVFYYFVFLVDAYANVFMTDFHQKGKIRIMGRMRASGFCAAVIAFFLSTLLLQNVVISLAVSGAFISIVYFIWVWVYRKQFTPIKIVLDFITIKQLAMTVLPIFILTLIMTYLGFAPNIYLGNFATMETVAICAILITPAALFQILLHTLLFGAPLPSTSEAYANGDLKRFSKRIHFLYILTIFAAVPFLIISYNFGIPLLTWIYNTDLSPYLRQLMFLSIGGLFTTAIHIAGVALIIMRKQIAYMYSYIAVGMICGPLVAYLVWKYGLDGAVLSNIIIFAPLTIIVYIIFRITLHREIETAKLTTKAEEGQT